MGLNQAGLHSW